MYYFARKDKRLRYNDNRLISIGETHSVKSSIQLCKKGLHASKNILDALRYAPGPILCKVKLHGDMIHGNDKSVATHRTYLDMIDATDILKRFAYLCALDVIHLWDAPDVVVKYLKTGDETLRVKAQSAVWSATWSATDGAARSVARHSARSAAQSAAWSVTDDAQWSATDGAARRAADSVAWNAVWNIGQSVARNAAWSAARKKQERRLYAMVGYAFAKQRKEL